ncbi:MAG TPA: hypothetical protein VJ623_08560 [Holophagaceae bacterium]|nr:hypothetical protein [Holophagaceae bacterium]
MSITIRILAASCGLGCLLGCGGGGGGASTAPAAPTFSVQVSPGSLQIPAGGSGYATVTISRLNGFNGAVTLSGLGFPAGCTASGTVPAGSAALALPIVVAGGVTPATFGTLQIEGRSGDLVRTAPFSLTVAPALPAPQLSEDAVQAPGGRQGGGGLVNVAVIQEPLRAAQSANPAGTVQVRHGYLPTGAPVHP